LKLFNKKFLCLLAVSFSVLIQEHARAGDDCLVVHRILHEKFSGREAELINLMNQKLAQFSPRKLGGAYCNALIDNLESKIASSSTGYVLSVERVIKHAILYEAFRIETFISSGVSPKRYFGFFDEEGDTASYEMILRETTVDAVRLVNSYAVKHAWPIRISEAEVAITFLSEGGALLLTNPEYSANRVHPVRGVGLDDFRIGFSRFPGLVSDFDSFFGTKLAKLLVPVGEKRVWLRPMTFREAVLGTALMYLYEKEIAATKMKKDWGKQMNALSFRKQFIATSLVYNSGILFVEERIEQIEKFVTADYLAEVNRKSNRPKLNVYSRAGSEQFLQNQRKFPRQLTSWSAVYHIIQRYGAWIAVEKFSNVFEGEHFTRRSGDAP
jgi:hypothetical protein